MAEISAATIERRARQLAENDGHAWQLELQGHEKRYEPLQPQRFLSEELRQKYLDRARAELSSEAQRNA